MSTNSTISLLQEDGSIAQIYSHWDGYLEHNGKILKNHYADYDKVKSLIDNGDLSSLRENIDPARGSNHDFDDPDDDVCVFYGRDRGENDIEARHYTDIDLFASTKHMWAEEYNYFYAGGKWYLLTGKDSGSEITDEMIKQGDYDKDTYEEIEHPSAPLKTIIRKNKLKNYEKTLDLIESVV